MLGTVKCTYETPCGWCTKWDKKCDSKVEKEDDSATLINATCIKHEWELLSTSSSVMTFVCKKCGCTNVIINK